MAGQGIPHVVHPESAFVPVSQNWLRTLESAGEAGPTRRVTGDPLRVSCICWRISPLTTYDEHERTVKYRGWLVFDGKSHGGAAARAFWHLSLDKFPDYGVLVLAGIKKIGWLATDGDAPTPNIELEAVDGIAPKVTAALRDSRIDTIAVTSQCAPEDRTRVSNTEQAKRALSSHPEAAERVRVVELT